MASRLLHAVAGRSPIYPRLDVVRCRGELYNVSAKLRILYLSNKMYHVNLFTDLVLNCVDWVSRYYLTNTLLNSGCTKRMIQMGSSI